MSLFVVLLYIRLVARHFPIAYLVPPFSSDPRCPLWAFYGLSPSYQPNGSFPGESGQSGERKSDSACTVKSELSQLVQDFFFPIWTTRRFPTSEYLRNNIHGVTNGLLVVFTVDKFLPLVVVYIR